MSLFGWFGRGGRSTEVVHPAKMARPSPTPRTESGWPRLREPPRPQDSALTEMARQWHNALQERHRPAQLCALYPRLANRLALCWGDPALASKVLDDLVVDRRRNRTGFPPAVSQELIRLRLLRPAPAAPSGFTPLWDASSMACGDR
ncbi:MAG: hypothetical protein QFE16_00535 [Pseudomonadota bacterium]|nr:hypothetical protein [Pseudomonadota bacterium]